MVAKQLVEEEYPNAAIEVVDSLCVSLGEGLLVNKALTMQAQGKALAEVLRLAGGERRSCLREVYGG